MRRPIKKRAQVEPDIKYSNVLVAKLINYLMKEGKKAVAMKVVYDTFSIIEQKTGKTGLEIFEKALDNVTPQMELRSRRIGGANYQVPIEVRPERKVALALRWILIAARSQKGKPMREKLAEELINAANNTGNAVKKKMDVHRMAEANKAFAHFAW
ncbi:MAG: 30S ribosomal protein S7 [Candidatus Yanofskybacteria bacterium RIFCSPHIGHO2_02_FULL_41_29]|uniref:Small ribosomal subunit protein uS7 n=1 Tax=Candidatus Yanofskybacteria bacterium RIFCSPHIGHO2_01_FULL_41_53 TaxID=1802663 RepID=A0A1F8EJZ9_9BACT|nr:MAG: 30S ribosomal protein S7 [Candidatus Yanofskybacteria bacterium RIFCSPHIGHO2_01_FULL_41_53]OGN11606.1 MAG: 30S ribosomal protein S7 [Candidatus Yanofskybacteria bacterium RIFCSPHIGHO2_02_FULL_41_29]OGN18671.1 MAG: 30S ribosomal protein S7 [Candidatus Yanofskybacteria bacterium RIFCSPHIGHO2_12_FULL_41_9]OGN22843.1 MAG: 30S ribosomal protein S7 [Candidatus Yanofskybacteria bacterium RIFCSPLOWO2_01_FULL_41_67]OGN30110.1 MAG: 30S ribosomal protein S7 [Candidatus Yanofskybacteria bacterium R